jgi:hypothetical protein
MTKQKPTPEEITEANQSVSRSKNSKRRGGAGLSVTLPGGAVLSQTESPKSETETALRKAAKSNNRRSN